MAEELKETVLKLVEEEAMPQLPSPAAAVATESSSSKQLDSKTRSRGGRRRCPAVPGKWENRRENNEKRKLIPMSVCCSYGGMGMQALFLDFTYYAGTGVFLPPTPPAYFLPTCYPVFLPCSVVQALNLNVHAPIHFSLNYDVKTDNNEKNNNNPKLEIPKHNQKEEEKQKKIKKKIPKAGDSKPVGKKTEKKAPKYQSSEKIYLPKEWIY